MIRLPEHERTGRGYWLRAVFFALLLMAAWLLWSGLFKPLLLALGVFSSVLVVYLAHRMRLFDSH